MSDPEICVVCHHFNNDHTPGVAWHCTVADCGCDHTLGGANPRRKANLHE